MGCGETCRGPRLCAAKFWGWTCAAWPWRQGRSRRSRDGVWRDMPGPGTLRSKVLGMDMRSMAMASGAIAAQPRWGVERHAGAQDFAQQSFGDGHAQHGHAVSGERKKCTISLTAHRSPLSVCRVPLTCATQNKPTAGDSARASSANGECEPGWRRKPHWPAPAPHWANRPRRRRMDVPRKA